MVLPWLTTSQFFEHAGPLRDVEFAGWDSSERSLREALEHHRVLPPEHYLAHGEYLDRVMIRQAPPHGLILREQVERLRSDITDFKGLYPGTHPVLVNLLPACREADLSECRSLGMLYAQADAALFPDLAYVLAAISEGVPVVNFTSNTVESPLVADEAVKTRVPLCGRDAKTGQTYLKVVLASALKARGLQVDGWYSLNILGNEDGKNLMDPGRGAGKLANKTELLDEILGYKVGERYGVPTHKVVIDYYPPRGDCKEAWDVIDFAGLFGLPMSLRLNLQARDSVLAAPMAIDLAWWMVCLHMAGRSGPVPELGFYFKKPVGVNPPVTFQDQLDELGRLSSFCLGKTNG